MKTAAETLKAYGMKNADALVEAARMEGLPLFIAAAFAEKESMGANVYGHDVGGYNHGAGEVTEANFDDFYKKVVVQKYRSNGVGPMQITWPGFFPDARARGLDLWVPLDNFRYGFRLLNTYLRGKQDGYSIEVAGTRYNGAETYGRSVRAIANKWLDRLGEAAGVPDQKKTKSKVKLVAKVKAKLTRKPLRRGSRGKQVRNLQAGLNLWFPSYSDLVKDGVFGSKTVAVVKEFQRRTGLKPDGIVGPKTRKMLRKYKIKL